jgi:hypothetical protein
METRCNDAEVNSVPDDAVWCRTIIRDHVFMETTGSPVHQEEIDHPTRQESDDVTVQQSVTEPGTACVQGPQSPEAALPTLDALLEIGLDIDDIFGEKLPHLSPSDMIKSRDRSPLSTREVSACVYDAVPYIKPPFEGWSTPSFPAPRNREEKKWLRGFLKGQLPRSGRLSRR